MKTKHMSLAEHWLRMAFGFFLIYTLRFLPGSWWVCGGWLHWLLPFMGYYAYHPPGLGWAGESRAVEASMNISGDDMTAFQRQIEDIIK